MPSLAEIIKKAKAQNFGENDSVIASSIRHPIKAGGKLSDWIKEQVSLAAAMPEIKDEGSMYAYEPSKEKQASAGINLAGLMQTGAMPFAPKSAGGTLGTFIGPKASGWDTSKAAKAAKLLDEGVMAGDKLSDIPLNQLINRYGDNGPSMSASLPETEFSKAHAIAQRNAALPVEQGGLGLHPENTAMDRAKALGFDTDAYHGSNEPLTTIGKGFEGNGLYTTNNPRVADDFAMWRRTYNGANVSPLMIKKGKNLEIDANYKPIRDVEANTNIPGMKYGETVDDYANRKRFDSILFKNVRDDVPSAPNMTPVSDVLRNIKARNIRSKFAAFNPMKKDSANILASILGGTALVSQYDKNRKQRRDTYPMSGDKLSGIPLNQLISKYK